MTSMAKNLRQTQNRLKRPSKIFVGPIYVFSQLLLTFGQNFLLFLFLCTRRIKLYDKLVTGWEKT